VPRSELFSKLNFKVENDDKNQRRFLEKQNIKRWNNSRQVVTKISTTQRRDTQNMFTKRIRKPRLICTRDCSSESVLVIQYYEKLRALEKAQEGFKISWGSKILNDFGEKNEIFEIIK
jgi:hypothetical protein